jgi:hypothetical protein
MAFVEAPRGARDGVSSKFLLSFSGFWGINVSREAACAKVLLGYFYPRIVALEVLPGITFFAINCFAVIICISAYAFDGGNLFLGFTSSLSKTRHLLYYCVFDGTCVRFANAPCKLRAIPHFVPSDGERGRGGHTVLEAIEPNLVCVFDVKSPGTLVFESLTAFLNCAFGLAIGVSIHVLCKLVGQCFTVAADKQPPTLLFLEMLELGSANTCIFKGLRYHHTLTRHRRMSRGFALLVCSSTASDKRGLLFSFRVFNIVTVGQS